jgi:hypothetical protein
MCTGVNVQPKDDQLSKLLNTGTNNENISTLLLFAPRPLLAVDDLYSEHYTALIQLASEFNVDCARGAQDSDQVCTLNTSRKRFQLATFYTDHQAHVRAAEKERAVQCTRDDAMHRNLRACCRHVLVETAAWSWEAVDARPSHNVCRSEAVQRTECAPPPKTAADDVTANRYEIVAQQCVYNPDGRPPAVVRCTHNTHICRQCVARLQFLYKHWLIIAAVEEMA